MPCGAVVETRRMTEVECFSRPQINWPRAAHLKHFTQFVPAWRTEVFGLAYLLGAKTTEHKTE